MVEQILILLLLLLQLLSTYATIAITTFVVSSKIEIVGTPTVVVSMLTYNINQPSLRLFSVAFMPIFEVVQVVITNK